GCCSPNERLLLGRQPDCTTRPLGQPDTTQVRRTGACANSCGSTRASVVTRPSHRRARLLPMPRVGAVLRTPKRRHERTQSHAGTRSKVLEPMLGGASSVASADVMETAGRTCS